MRCAVFSCKGLGDGLVSLVISHNMSINGWKVDTFHNKQLNQLQSWFPHLPISSFPKKTFLKYPESKEKGTVSIISHI